MTFGPDADLDSIGLDAPLRDELELDSLDFLSFLEQLSNRIRVSIDSRLPAPHDNGPPA